MSIDGLPKGQFLMRILLAIAVTAGIAAGTFGLIRYLAKTYG